MKRLLIDFIFDGILPLIIVMVGTVVYFGSIKFAFLYFGLTSPVFGFLAFILGILLTYITLMVMDISLKKIIDFTGD